jgi:hypothetical protein
MPITSTERVPSFMVSLSDDEVEDCDSLFAWSPPPEQPAAISIAIKSRIEEIFNVFIAEGILFDIRRFQHSGSVNHSLGSPRKPIKLIFVIPISRCSHEIK